nr:uncharacterized protein LOC122269934 [Parasteatoda tepidariorum]
MAAQINFIKSSRGKEMLNYRDNLFYFHSSYKDVQYWVCMRKKTSACKSKVSLRNGIIVKETGFHNHSADSNKIANLQFVQEVKTRLLQNPEVPVPKMYKSILAETATSVAAAANIPAYASIKTRNTL